MKPRCPGLLELTLVLMLVLLPGSGSARADAAPGPAEEGGARVVLEPVVQVTGGMVTLAEIARLEGPAELTQRLQEVPVGPAPLPGRSRWVETGYLAVRLRQAGIDPQKVRIEGPERVELITGATPGAPEQVEPAEAGTASAGVARGETVVLEAVAGPVVIQVSARTLKAGQAGDRIPVINLSSGREVEAIVVGPGRVRSEVAL